MLDKWHKKEKPVFTGITRGLGGFGFGAASAGTGGGSDFSATGGFVSDYTDGGSEYRAHVFMSPGTFTATGSGTVDYLVIGGGGGGGTSGGGGGGAGLVRYVEGQSVLAGPYAITVGQGGTGGVAPQNRGSQGGSSSIAFPSTVTSPGGGGGGGVTGFDGGGNGGAGGGGAGPSGGGGTGSGDKNHPGAADVVSPANGWGGDGGDSTNIE